MFSSIDVESGRVRWSKPLPNLTYNGPLSINGLVFLGETNPGMFRAYDAANGNILWQVSPADTVLGRFDLRDRFSQIVSAIQLTSMHLWHRLRHAADFGFEDIHAPPIAYRMNGREYVVITADVYARALRPGGNTVFAFALP